MGTYLPDLSNHVTNKFRLFTGIGYKWMAVIRG